MSTSWMKHRHRDTLPRTKSLRSPPKQRLVIVCCDITGHVVMSLFGFEMGLERQSLVLAHQQCTDLAVNTCKIKSGILPQYQSRTGSTWKSGLCLLIHRCIPSTSLSTTTSKPIYSPSYASPVPNARFMLKSCSLHRSLKPLDSNLSRKPQLLPPFLHNSRNSRISRLTRTGTRRPGTLWRNGSLGQSRQMLHFTARSNTHSDVRHSSHRERSTRNQK